MRAAAMFVLVAGCDGVFGLDRVELSRDAPPPIITCSEDAECVRGREQGKCRCSTCAYVDPQCTVSELRHVEGAGQGLSGACVAAPAQIDSSVYHTCTRLTDGSAWCWGFNDDGPLGRAQPVGQSSPTPVRVTSNEGPLGAIAEIGTGAFFTCARRDDGTVACWGSNQSGQLGGNLPMGAGQRSLDPVTVRTQTGPLTNVVRLEVGYYHACAVTEDPLNSDQQLYCWGDNGKHQLGNAAGSSAIAIPVTVPNTNIMAFSAGGEVTCAIVDSSATLPAAYCWGRQWEGRLADNVLTDTTIAAPQRVLENVGAPLAGMRSLEVGGTHACAIDPSAGTLYCWGRNTDGKLGSSGTTPRALATPITAAAGEYHLVGAGDRHTCTAYGDQTWCFGSDADGRLGNGPTTTAPQSMPVIAITGERLRDLAVSFDAACALGVDGRIRCWGRNTEGQLGVGDFLSRDTPTDIMAIETCP